MATSVASVASAHGVLVAMVHAQQTMLARGWNLANLTNIPKNYIDLSGAQKEADTPRPKAPPTV